jgi:4-amino-4-deoxy-L-arabinose transferase-like glycosyltransferase
MHTILSDRKMWVLFGIALLLRLILFVPVLVNPELAYVQGATRTTDATGYHALGTALMNRQSFDSAYRTPGYPFFLSTLYQVAGAPDARYPVVVQILVSAFLVFLVVRMGSSLFGRRAGLIAGAAYAISPLAALFSDRLMTESLASCLYFVSLYLLCAYFHAVSHWKAFLSLAFAGVTMSGAVMVGPSGFYLLYVLPVLLIAVAFRFSIVRGVSLRRIALSVAAGLTFFVFSVSLVVPWMLRNEAVYGVRFFTTMGNYNLVWSFALATIATERGVPAQELVPDMAQFTADRGGGDVMSHPTEAALAAYNRMGVELISEHPGAFLLAYAKGTVLGLFGFPVHGAGYKSQFFGVVDESSPLFPGIVGLHALHVGFFFLFATLLLVGYRWLVPEVRRKPEVALLLLVSLYFLFVFGPIGGLRYRLFAFPVDSLIVGFAAVVLLARVKVKSVAVLVDRLAA